MTGRPAVHALLVTWNHYAVTRDCLTTLFAADYPAEQLTVWVVDNASSDGTPVSIRAEFPQARLLEHTWNAGFARGINRAARAVLDSSNDPYLLILNNDTLLDPTMIGTLVDALEAHPEAGIAAPAIYYAHDPERL
ncbi:MAG TPA: glycosyltransferase, partial [bacterium]|nr:glycosyltransferase [bacterium]